MQEFQYVILVVVCLIMIFCSCFTICFGMLSSITKKEETKNFLISLNVALIITLFFLYVAYLNSPTFPE
jgi:uncharacterized lipoprotein YehR (DUF1307 family)